MTITMTTNEKTFGFRFKEWDIYQDSRKFRKKINELVKKYPPVVACLDCALDSEYITTEQHNDMLLEAGSLAKRLRNFTKFLS